ncbi:MAG: prepilin-type N-terminal cleavage/methylation domain-containing protein [Rickettsiales bacterium]|nr:prepilin-type N-terminal cleavage/methylation domain-containing protein [Rickettsiales bacterium]
MNIKKRAGFTLIELSIVLVIIGLIIGGVLVGRDLIKGAELRAAVSQMERYDTAVNIFRNKYSGLPGDFTRAGSFGFYSTDITPNGNSLLEINPGGGASSPGYISNEVAVFFRHLTQSGLISDNIEGGDCLDPFSSGETLANYFAASKLAPNTYIIPIAKDGLNYYYLLRGMSVGAGDPGFLDGADAGNTGAPDFKPYPAIPVMSAFQMDSKLDDGIATTGRVVTTDNGVSGTAGADDSCQTGGVYTTTPDPELNTCQLRIRTSF